MQRPSRPDVLDVGSTRGPRSHSISSDRPSLSATSLLSPPTSASPEPLFIAPSAASQLISAELDAEGATISSGALALLNAFLDQILFTVLARARSTQLNALRPAAIDVLKARLGKEAVAGADEELREYLGDGEDEELETFYGGQEPKGDFDLELAWKLARLRCMVYTRLGDMEEDDEDEWIERENLDDGSRTSRRYSNPSSVTPAAAIFLTSILEYLGEQALYYAGQATQRRIVTSQPLGGDFTALPGIPDKLPTVEETDMFAVGRDSPLSRLWRTWRRSVKSPRGSINRMFSHESLARRDLSSRHGSISVAGEGPEQSRPSVAEVLETDDPSNLPLPMSENDINEIEVPGLAHEIDDDGNVMASQPGLLAETASSRPKSMFIATQDHTPPTPNSPTVQGQRSSGRPYPNHLRSRSLPTPVQSPFASPFDEERRLGEGDFVTPMEKADPLEKSDEPVEPVEEKAESVVPVKAATDEVADDASEAGSVEGTSAAALAAAMAGDTVGIPDESPSEASPTSQSSESRVKIASNEPKHVNDHEVTPKGGTAELLALKAARVAAINTTKSSPTTPRSVSSSQRTPTDQEKIAVVPSEKQTTVPAKQRDPGFVLGAAPQPRRDKNVEKPTSPKAKETLQETRTTVVTQPTPPRKDSAAPRSTLAPLREMMENAGDTSDEATSVVASTATQGRARLVNSSNDVKPSSQTPKSRVPVTADRPLPAPERSMNNNRSQRSSSFNEPKLVSASPQRPAKQPTLDGVETSTGGRTQRSASDGKQSLEDLIKTDATLHYTLTPQNVRETDPLDYPRSQKRTATADLADFLRNTAPPGDNAPRSIASRQSSSTRPTNGLRSHPPDSTPRTTSSMERRDRAGSHTGSFEQASPARSSRTLNVQPRDATIERNTTRDLADFAKSTGPDTATQLPKSLKARLLRSSVDGTSHAEIPTRSESTTPNPKQQGFLSRQISNAKRHGPHLQARDATVARDDQSSDLIDFIREGPPRDPREGVHRIPRNVAPFRNTKDSEDMVGVTSPRDRDLNGRISLASTQASSFVAKSMQSSTNSRTGLLDSTNRVTNKPSNGAMPPLSGRSFGIADDFEETMQPKRKQRRVRDPYAIDTDSEEEEEAEVEEESTPKPRKARNGEESLMDFLRNTSPPPETNFQPQALALSPEQQAKAMKRLKQSSSSPTLQGHSSRTISTNGLQKTAPVTDGMTSYQRGSNPVRQANYSPKQINPRSDSLNPMQPINASQRGRVSVPKPASAAPGLAPKRAGVGATADLADFLRNSAPPEPVRRARSPSPIEEERLGFARIFSRRRKVAV